jgi:hypothetical protein
LCFFSFWSVRCCWKQPQDNVSSSRNRM